MARRVQPKTTAAPTPEQLGFALVHLARVAAEEAAAGSQRRLTRFIPRAIALIASHAQEDVAQLERERVVRLTADVTALLREHARAPLTRQAFEERLDDSFDSYGWGLGWSANRKARDYAWNPQRHQRLNQGPKQVAAEVVGRALGIAPRSIFAWQKRRHSMERDRRLRSLRALKFFVDALIQATLPSAQTILADIRDQVDSELTRRTR